MFTRRNLCAGGLAVGAGLWAGAAPAQAQAKVTRVPLTLSSSKKPIVEVKLNGKGPYRFILDTGASHTVIRASLATELGLTSTGQGRSRSLKGTEYTTRYTVSEVMVGGVLRLRDWQVFGSKGYEAAEHDGLLSADLLTRLPCQLDQRGGEIRYYLGGDMPLEGFGPLDSYYKSDLVGGADKVHIRLRFAGHELDCLLDTGASRPLYIRGDFVREHGLWDKYPLLGESELIGVNGQKLKVRNVEVKDLQVGGVWVPRMVVALGDPNDRAAYGQEGDGSEGIVGAPFLSGFVLAFTAARSLQVKPSGSFAAMAPPEKHVSNAPASTAERPIIPFRLGEDRRFMFSVGEGPQPMAAVFDTSEGRSSVGADLAAKYGLKPKGSGYDGASLRLNGVAMTGIEVQVAKTAKQPLWLGMDFIDRLPCALDLDNKYMALFPTGAPDTTGYDNLPVVREADGTMVLAGSLMGKPMRFLLHTAQGYGVLLSPATVKAHALWDAFPKAENRLSGDGKGGMSKIRFTGVPELDFGPFRIDPAPVTLMDPEVPTDPAFAGVDGIIGIGVLWRFNMIFADGKVWFKPNNRFGGGPTSRPPGPA